MLRLIYAIRAALSSPITPYLRSNAKRRQQRLGEALQRNLTLKATRPAAASGQRQIVEARFPYWK
jgi:hypothetical protein